MSLLSGRQRHAAAAFTDVFGGPPDATWSAPGRVNLLGEHTDYNGGLCLPMAVDFRADCAIARTSSGRVRIASAQRPGEVVDLALCELAPGSTQGWSSYVAGAVWAHPGSFSGLDVLIDSDVPEGAGLSSSAALECATLGALGGLAGLELAQVGQRAENEFVGVPCGLMDQLAATLSRAGHALLFDAGGLTAEPVPLELSGHGLSLLVVDTQAPHRLIDGGYAQRRDECRKAATELGVASLREAEGIDVLSESLRSRARHVVTEIDRVEQAVQLLRAGHADQLGPLMTASHESLRHDFRVSSLELDLAVDAALSAGALGARMTGGGFGGSIIALTTDAPAVATAVQQQFAAAGLAEPRWFVAEPVGGLRPVG
ncbi:MAG: galactokinase [Mycobacteriales bacterium]